MYLTSGLLKSLFRKTHNFKLLKHNSTKTKQDVVEQSCPCVSNGG